MNERIEELKNQASIVVDACDTFGERLPQAGVLDADKFAALVVEECIEIMMTAARWYQVSGKHGAVTALCDTATAIREEMKNDLDD